MKKAMVEKTPQVWNAWFICSWDGYVTAASIMIHQPVKNWKEENTLTLHQQQDTFSCLIQL